MLLFGGRVIRVTWRKGDGDWLVRKALYDEMFVYYWYENVFVKIQGPTVHLTSKFLLLWHICCNFVTFYNWSEAICIFSIPLDFMSNFQILLFMFTWAVRVKVRRKRRRRFPCCQRRKWTSWEPNWWKQKSWATRWVGHHCLTVSHSDLQRRLL